MSTVNTLNVGGVNFPIEDTAARSTAATAQTAAGNAQTAANNANSTAQGAESLANSALSQIEAGSNPLTLGANLATKFLAEISAAPFSGNVWAWIQARIQAGNFAGINVGDFIPFSAGGNDFNAEIAGINTYFNYGDTAVLQHIDFITRELWPDTKGYNPVNYNNGLGALTTPSVQAARPSPWLASDIKAWLNSEAALVPNGTGADPAVLSVNYATTGVWDKLPAALQAVIIQKRALLPSRYSAGNLLTDDNSWVWSDAGRLWLPSEIEVYGCRQWGSNLNENPGFSSGGFQQYPIFSCNMRRLKLIAGTLTRAYWWLLSARGGHATYCCAVGNNGSAHHGNASVAYRAPLCFRIA
jgi:hypothetical protein